MTVMRPRVTLMSNVEMSRGARDLFSSMRVRHSGGSGSGTSAVSEKTCGDSGMWRYWTLVGITVVSSKQSSSFVCCIKSVQQKLDNTDFISRVRLDTLDSQWS